ncbi:hypothetical protein Misp06_00442 [Microbulbifer sp. NBRC 101763]|uniref:hypothetical protein n=1 Tax=Microbulbifer sp. NBRC 101763 TaxID=1113820 RepID=UPI0030A5C5D9
MWVRSAYKKFLRQAKLKIAAILLVSGAVAFFVYDVFESFFICIMTFVLSVVTLYFLVGGRLRYRREQVDNVFGCRFSLAESTPIYEEDQSEWLKGIGFISDTAQPMWVKADHEGVYLYYLSRSRIPPIIVIWSNVNRVHLFLREEGSLANLFVDGLDNEIYVPWSEEFNEYIPASVGVSYEC